MSSTEVDAADNITVSVMLVTLLTLGALKALTELMLQMQQMISPAVDLKVNPTHPNQLVVQQIRLHRLL